MRAIAYAGSGGRDVIALRDDVPEPIVGSDDVLVDVAFAGLNRADILERRGLYAVPPGATSTPGMEFSGIVRAVGAKVSDVARGDRVCGLVVSGAHAELLATNAAAVSRVPEGVSLRDAAAIPEAFTTAHDALFGRAGFVLGETAVVHAVGSSVGLAAVALVKAAGGVAIGTSRTVAKLERARAHGLDFGFALADGWIARVLEATAGRGPEVILDFVGAPMLEDNLRALAPGGRIVQIGTMAGNTAQINLGALMQKRAALHGTVLRSRPLYEKVALAREFESRLLPLFARGVLRAEIDATFEIGRMAEAHEHMEADRNFGKIVIEIGGEP